MRERYRWMDDVLDLVDEQQFRHEKLSDGHSFKVFPKGPGLPIVMVRASSAPYAYKNVHAHLRRIGVEIPHRSQKAKPENRPMRPNTQSPPPPATNGHDTSPPKPVNNFEAVRAKIDQALDCLAEASEMLSELEKGAAKMNQLRELLREAL